MRIGFFGTAESALGLPSTRPAAATVAGIPEADPGALRSAMTLFDYGVDPVEARLPLPPSDNGGHLAIRINATALAQIDAFLRDGRIVHPCDGPCDPR